MNNQLAGKRVAIYARYSSHLQREASIEDQVRRCSDYVAVAGGRVDPELVFADHAISGASLCRSGFEHMMRLVAEKRVDAIVTEDVGRISRDFADSADIFRRLQYQQIPLLGVADGVDTSAKHGKVTFHIKALVNDIYLDDLRDKTLRGLEGRARAGFSTGGLPYGYRSRAEVDAHGKVIGYRVEADPSQAEVVRRVFALYLEGQSLDGIARRFNAEQVPPPRANSRHRQKGWVATTIRAFLHNAAYIGEWTYKRRQWVKAPGTNARRPRLRAESDVIAQVFPERRIVDQGVWDATQQRLRSVRAFYSRRADGDRAVPGRSTTYPLSGLLFCGACGAPMTIAGGSSMKYYRCSHAKHRGTCTNNLSVREDVARSSFLAALRRHFSSPAAVAYVRKRVAERLGEVNRTLEANVTEGRQRLARTEARIAGLIEFIANGDQSDYVRRALLDLEHQAKADRAAIHDLERQAEKPIRLPSPEVVVGRALDIERMVAQDPTRARIELRKLFEDGRILLHPQPEGFYRAETTMLPLVLMLGPQTQTVREGIPDRATALSCAGRI